MLIFEYRRWLTIRRKFSEKMPARKRLKKTRRTSKRHLRLLRNSAAADEAASSKWLRLPNELWLHVFSHLPLMDLFNAEQVCELWKDLVDKQLRSRRHLTVDYSTCSNNVTFDAKRILRRYGGNLEELTVIDANKCDNIMEKIGDWCPKLVKLVIEGETHMTDTALSRLARNCDQLQSVSLLGSPSFTDKGLEFMLKNLTQLKQLKIDFDHVLRCLKSLGPNIEDLTLHYIRCLPTSFILSLPVQFKNLRKLNISTVTSLCGFFEDNFSEICVNIKELSLGCRFESQMLTEISKMWWLEKLQIINRSYMDDKNLQIIAHGCPNLRVVSLIGRSFTRITDEGVKYLIDHCLQLVELDISRNAEVTDVALDHMATYGHLRRVAVRGCRLITDRGCVYFIARCPQLVSLDIRHCPQLTSTVIRRCTRAVRNRTDRKPLTLMVKGTSIEISDVKLDCPRLIVEFRETLTVDICQKRFM